jgi:hypothetical protein
MKEIMDNILKSFNTKREGYSSRKLTAFVVVIMVLITHIKWITLGNFAQLEMVLSIDYAFIAALFGMTTYHSLKSNDGKVDVKIKEETPDEPTEEN